MHWLLTNTAEPDSAPFSTWEKRPSLGLGFLISALRKAGHQVTFIDNYLKPSNFLDTDFLVREKIDAIGISVNTVCFRDFRVMAQKIKKMRDDGTWRGLVAVGGPHTGSWIESIPDWVDHIVVGEGEDAIVKIADGTDQRVFREGRREQLEDLDPPAYEEFVNLPYQWDVYLMDAKRVFTMNTSRGCPFKCTFCSVPAQWGTRYRYFSGGWIVEQAKFLHDTYGADGIYFREDNFTVSRKRTREFCEGMLKNGLRMEWMCETRVDALNREILQLMYDAGCRAIYVGVEHGSQRMLDFMKKSLKVEQIEEAFALANEIGIRSYASYVVGAPTETEEDLRQLHAMRKRLKATSDWLNVFVGLPRSFLFDYVMENNLFGHIDDRGLVYLKDHDALIDKYYGGIAKHKVPRETLPPDVDYPPLRLAKEGRTACSSHKVAEKPPTPVPLAIHGAVATAGS